MKYTITRANGEATREAASLREALRISRSWLGVDRVFKGAEYFTDYREDNERISVTALDVWRSRKNANSQMDTCADAVISWR